MSNEKKIFRDLALGRSSTTALAALCGIDVAAVQIILNRLQSEGLIESFPLEIQDHETMPSIIIWRFTPLGRSRIKPPLLNLLSNSPNSPDSR